MEIFKLFPCTSLTSSSFASLPYGIKLSGASIPLHCILLYHNYTPNRKKPVIIIDKEQV
jgi:hypothetical protein